MQSRSPKLPSSKSSLAFQNELSQMGFVLVRGMIGREAVEQARQAPKASAATDGVRARGGVTYAVRNLLDVVPALRSTVVETVRHDVIQDALGDNAFVTRAILFDKRPTANWRVGWHQDTTIAVERKVEVTGFGPWSVKSDVVHVRPPAEVLTGMVTARVALDDCDASNGALRVIAESHRHGLLDSNAIRAFIDNKRPSVVTCRAGDVLLMKPLLLHASPPAQQPARRRVIHLEFASDPLPEALQWRRA